MGIFAIIGAITMTMLGSMVTGKDKSDGAAHRLEHLQMTSLLLSRDFNQSLDRSVRDSFGDSMPPFWFQENPDGMALMLVRAGVETGVTASRLQRVIWKIRDGELYRGGWNVLDGAGPAPDFERALGHGAAGDDIQSWSLRFHYQDGAGEMSYASEWPLPQEMGHSSPLPRAVEIRLTLARTGPVELFYALPR